jgi:creatinine amidohydrolase
MPDTHRQKNVRWEEMFPEELLEAIEECPVCWCPYGLAEPHGLYNALGLDWLKAQALCERAARTHGGVVMPPMAWHVQERPTFRWLESQGVEQSLCSSIPPALFLQTVLHQIRSIDARGFHVAILVTGHYGGIEHDMELLCEYYTRRTGSPLRLLADADWRFIRHEDYGGDHAGIVETSQLMALRPELVEMERRRPGKDPWIGHVTDAKPPGPELGEKIVQSQIERLGDVQRELLDAYAPRDDWQAPSHTDTAALWTRFEAVSRRYWVMDQTFAEYKGERPKPAFPGWAALEE